MAIKSYPQFVSEMPLPKGWDEKVFTLPGTYDASDMAMACSYAAKRAKTAGIGSGRWAFRVQYEGRPTILKMAQNVKGAAQNKAEAEMMFDVHYTTALGLIIPGIDYDKTNDPPLWIHMEQANKITNAQFKKFCGGLPEDLVVYTQLQLGIPAVADVSMYAEPEDINPKAPLTKAFVDFAENWPELLDDYVALHNWGLYKGKPVIIDVGFSSTVGKQHYGTKAPRPVHDFSSM